MENTDDDYDELNFVMDIDFESPPIPEDITKEILDLIEDWDDDIMEEFLQITIN